ncbi:hypothetical protein Trydic_g11225 [Trypoxylus dichotomus]
MVAAYSDGAQEGHKNGLIGGLRGYYGPGDLLSCRWWVFHFVLPFSRGYLHEVPSACKIAKLAMNSDHWWSEVPRAVREWSPVGAKVNSLLV